MVDEANTEVMEQDEKIDLVLNRCPVMPVMTEKDPKRARQIAEVLLDNGITVLEIALRTASALDIIREVSMVEGMMVGAGTVLNPTQLEDALEAGAKFIVSPGITVATAEAARRHAVPYLPGVATPSDVMLGKDLGLKRFKFFPAGTFGGIDTLKAYSSVFPDVRWMPSGGVDVENYKKWLALPSVSAVGTSWLTSGSPDMKEIKRRVTVFDLPSITDK